MGNSPSHQANSSAPSNDTAQSPSTPGGVAATSSLGPGKERPAAPPSPAPPSTPLLLPYAGHLSPQNPHCLSHPQVHDYSKTVVTQLILDQQLAPFYRGLDDFEEDWTEREIRTALDETREKDFAEDVQNSFTQRLKEARSGGKRTDWAAAPAEDRAERIRREDKAYLGAVECPICFLNYPSNINTSRCCEQPLCTECFVQIKRGEATTTHLESEPACCPYCVESDFGVIYERPTPVAAGTPLSGLGISPPSAFATSPDAGMSGFSALSMSEDPLSVGSPGSAPMIKPVQPRRKSVSSKAKEVVTIDQIRPDWETKLNAVKAAAARRAARRIVMRQVGDRLIPIGYTSSRATGQADFSMSIPQEEGRRSRRNRDRERDLEEMMIMEAMRLSMLDHEEHQRKIADEDKGKNGQSTPVLAQGSQAGPSTLPQSPQPVRSGTTSPTPSSSRRSSSAGNTLSSWRASSQNDGGGRAQAAASKLLSKITVNRSRANSKSSVHFAPSPTTMGGSPANSHPPSLNGVNAGRSRSSSTPSPNPIAQQQHIQSPLACMTNDAQPLSRHSVDVPPRAVAPDELLPVRTVTTTSDATSVNSGSTLPGETLIDVSAESNGVPTAANPHPELAALMADAVGDDTPPLRPTRHLKPEPQAVPQRSSSVSTSASFVTNSSLGTTPPGTSRPSVPLSAMADEDD